MTYFFLRFFCLLFIYTAQDITAVEKSTTNTIKAVVSLGPYAYFVKRIGGEYVDPFTIVPAGTSAHSYEPTARQILQAAKADVWFSIGERFELRAVQAIKSYRNDLMIIDLTQGIDVIRENSEAHKGCSHGGFDPHIWLSPQQVKRQAVTIVQTLSTLAPQHATYFKENFNKLTADLDALHNTSKAITEQLPCRTFLVSHPSYSYFARDYALRQLSIEVEGKDPSAQQLTRFLQEARAAQVSVIFVQPQHSTKAAIQIAHQLHGSIISLDPYAEDYFASMHAFLKALANDGCDKMKGQKNHEQ